MRYVSMIICGLSLLIVQACGGEDDSLPEVGLAPAQAARGTGSNDVRPAVKEADTEPSTRSIDDGPEILEVHLLPDPPVATASFSVEPVVDNPAVGPLHLEYEWTVNGYDVLGVFSDTLRAEHFSAGDRISVSILVKDRRGKVATTSIKGIQVSNSTPQIVSSLGTAPRLDGFAFEAVDPDGDTVAWSLEGSPPGMTIGERSGRISIDTSKVHATGTYDIEVVATDPAGAQGRLRFQAALGGSAEAHTDVVTVEDGKLVAAETYSDEEYIERAEKHFEKMENMSAEELNAYLERRLQAEEEMEAIGATELPVGAPPTPYGSGD